MTKWELATCYADVNGSIDPKAWKMWRNKDKKTGKSDWDNIQEMAAQGWELVSVTSIGILGSTSGLLYTFQRPLQDGE